MGWGKKPDDKGQEYRGGCAEHDMRGPARSTFKAASKDATGHNKRLHGGKNASAYIERRK